MSTEQKTQKNEHLANAYRTAGRETWIRMRGPHTSAMEDAAQLAGRVAVQLATNQPIEDEGVAFFVRRNWPLVRDTARQFLNYCRSHLPA